MMEKSFNRKDISTIIIGAILSAAACYIYKNSETAAQVLSAIFIGFAYTLPVERQLMMVALSLPNTMALGLGGVSASVIICAVAVFKYLITGKEKVRIPAIVPFYLFYSLQFVFRYGDLTAGLVMPIKTALTIIFFSTLSRAGRVAENSYVIGFKSVIALFAGIVAAFWSSNLGSDNTSRMAVEDNDPNILAVEVAFVLSYICVNYYSAEKASKVLFLASAIILSIISLFCGSRMGFILLGFVLVSFIFLNVKKFSKSILLVVVFGGAISAFLLSSTGQAIVDILVARSEVLELEGDVSNGRYELWETYIALLNSDPMYWLFGIGDYTNFGITVQAHNVFIEDVAYLGIVGVIILYSTYIHIFRIQYKNSKRFNPVRRKIMFIIPLLVPLIGGMTLHSYLSIMNITMIYLGVMCLTKPIGDLMYL